MHKQYVIQKDVTTTRGHSLKLGTRIVAGDVGGLTADQTAEMERLVANGAAKIEGEGDEHA